MATWCKQCHWGKDFNTTEVPMSWTTICPKKHMIRFSAARGSPIRMGLPWEEDEDCPDFVNRILTRFERILESD